MGAKRRSNGPLKRRFKKVYNRFDKKSKLLRKLDDDRRLGRVKDGN